MFEQPTLHFPQLDRRIVARSDESVFQAARRHGVRVVGACGGRGTCGTCVVRVTGAEIEALDGFAADLAGKRWVRACRVKPRGDAAVEIAPRSLAPVRRATETGVAERWRSSPPRCCRRRGPPPTWLSLPADADRLRRAFGPTGSRELEACVSCRSGWRGADALCGGAARDAVIEVRRPAVDARPLQGFGRRTGRLISSTSGRRRVPGSARNPHRGGAVTSSPGSPCETRRARG